MKLPNGYNDHHPYFDRRTHNARQITALLRRNLIVPMIIQGHNELHANVPPIKRPSDKLARFSLDVIADTRVGMGAEQSGKSVFEALWLSYRSLGRCRGQFAEEARAFGDFFEDQLPYIREYGL